MWRGHRGKLVWKEGALTLACSPSLGGLPVGTLPCAEPGQARSKGCDVTFKLPAAFPRTRGLPGENAASDASLLPVTRLDTFRAALVCHPSFYK